MKFIEPSLKEVYKILNGNKELIDYLKKENLLLTKGQFYGTEKEKNIQNIDSYIYTSNSNTLYNIAQILLENKEEIKEKDLWVLCSNKVGLSEIASCFNISDELSIDAYKKIIYTYKYGYVSSFFQNNKDKFFADIDLEKIEENDSLNALTDAILKEFDKMDQVISKCSEYRDFDKIPFDLINYLSQLIGFEKANLNISDKDEKKYREIIKNIIDLYRVKGTNYSFEVFFKFLGYNIKIEEFYFDRRMKFSNIANAHTNVQDPEDFRYYLVPENPADNKLNISYDEFVRFNDFTPQYSLREFNDLVKEYGADAVLGYSKYDKNNNVYENKIYKYFKTNVIYYSVSLDKTNLTDVQLLTVNKILSFLTPAYIMKNINIKVYTGATEDSISDNIIFFDREIDLEALEEGLEEDDKNGREILREHIRNNYPIMLDSESRDSDEGKEDWTAPNIDGTGLTELTDTGIEVEYKNSVNTSSYKKKIPLKINRNEISANDHFIDPSKPSALMDIKKVLKNLKKDGIKNRDVNFITSEPIEECINNDLELNKLGYQEALIHTLCLKETKSETANLDAKESYEGVVEKVFKEMSNRYTFCNDLSSVLELDSHEKDFINPSSIKNKRLLKNLSINNHVFAVYKNTIDREIKIYCMVYSYGQPLYTNKLYNNSYDVKLISAGRLYRYKKQEMDINIPSEKKVFTNSIEDAYGYIKDGNVKDLSLYYHTKDNNEWHYSIKKASLIDRIISGETYKFNYDVLPDESNEYGIPIFYKYDNLFSTDKPKKNNDGTYTFEGVTASSPLDLISEENKYCNYKFFIEDYNNKYDSDLYELIYLNRAPGLTVYSTYDNRLYELDESYVGYHEISPIGSLEKISQNEYKIFGFDKYWKGYNEADEIDNYIFYNTDHRFYWNIWDDTKFENSEHEYRPIRYRTDIEVDEDINLRKNIIRDIFDNTFSDLNAFVEVGTSPDGKIIKNTMNHQILKELGLIEDRLRENFINEKITLEEIQKISNILSKYKLAEDVTSESKENYEDIVNGDVYPNVYYLFKDFIDNFSSSDKRDEFIKEYYYIKYLENWRTYNPVKELSVLVEAEQRETDKFNNKYEMMDGKGGFISNPTTLNSYYQKDEALKIEFYRSEGNKFYIKKDKIKVKDITDILLASPVFNSMYYSYGNYKAEAKKTEYGYVITLLDFEKNNLIEHTNSGFLIINKINQKLIDNIINYPLDENTMSLLPEYNKSLGKVWSNNGDDRTVSIKVDVETNVLEEINYNNVLENIKTYNIMDFIDNREVDNIKLDSNSSFVVRQIKSYEINFDKNI